MNPSVPSPDMQLAADHEASAAALSRLAKQRIPVLDQLLAGNPAVPQRVLFSLALCWPVEFLDNPMVLLWTLEGTSLPLDIELVEAAARYRLAMEAEGPECAAAKVGYKERCRFASMPEQAMAMLPYLVRDPDAFVRELIFQYLGRVIPAKRFPRDYLPMLEPVLDHGVEDPCAEVRKHLPLVQGLGERRLLALAEDACVGVRLAVASIPSDWEAELAQLRLVESSNRSVLLRLCKNPRLSTTVVMRLALVGAEVQLQLAKQAKLNAEVALLLASLGNLAVCQHLAVRNWSNVPAVYEALAGRFTEVDRLLLDNPHIRGPAIGRLLANGSIEERCRCCSAAQISPWVLSELALDAVPAVQSALAQRMRRPGHQSPTHVHVTVCNWLVLSPQAEVRELLMSDRRLTAESIRYLRKVSDADGLVLLAENPSLPYEVAFELFNHTSESVARACMAAAGRKCAQVLLGYARRGQRRDLLYYGLLCGRFMAAVRGIEPLRWSWVAATRGTPDCVLGWLAQQGNSKLYESLATQFSFSFMGRLLECADGQVLWVRWKELTRSTWAHQQSTSPNAYQRGWYARFCPRKDEVNNRLAREPHPFVQAMLQRNPRFCHEEQRLEISPQ